MGPRAGLRKYRFRVPFAPGRVPAEKVNPVAPRSKSRDASRRQKPAPLDPDDWLEGDEDIIGEADLMPAIEPEPEDQDEDEPEDVITSTSGIVVTKMRLATITGLAPATLDKAFAAGAPVIAKGNRKQGWQINTAAFIAWYLRWKVDTVAGNPGKMDFEAAKTRKAVADAERVEMENERKRGNTITIDEAVAVYREEASIIRSQLMAIPGRVATMGHAATNKLELELLVRDEIDIALQNISGDTLEAWKENAARAAGGDDESV